MANLQIFELSGAVGYTSTWVVPSTAATSGDAQKISFADLVQTGLGSGYITSGMLGNNAVVSGSVASGQIGLNHLASGVLANAVLTSGQVTSGILGLFSVNSGNLSSGAVNSFNIASGSVGPNHLASGSVGVAGSSGQLQYNAGGVLGASAGLSYNASGNLIVNSGDALINGMTVGKGNGQNEYNTVVGAFALASGNAFVDQNTAIGRASLGVLRSGGTANAAVGGSSLGNLINGANNTAVGVYALGYLASGSYNTGVGRNAGLYTSGANNFLSGASQGVYLGGLSQGFAVNEQNAIVIGYNAQGHGSGTTVIGTTNTVSGTIYGNINFPQGARINTSSTGTIPLRIITSSGHTTNSLEVVSSGVTTARITPDGILYISQYYGGIQKANTIINTTLANPDAAYRSVVIGANASVTSGATAGEGVAIGYAASVTGQYGVAVGQAANGGNAGVALGISATATGVQSIGIGQLTASTHSASIGLGPRATSTAAGDIVFATESQNPTIRTQRFDASNNISYLMAGASTWIDSTAATKTSRFTLSTYYTSTAQEAIRIDSATDLARVAMGGAVLSGHRVTIYTGQATEEGLGIRGFASQTARYLEVSNSAGTHLAGINASGVITSEVGMQFQTSTASSGTPFIMPAPAGTSTVSEKGTGWGRSLLVQAGQSDNTSAGAGGGDLVLRGGDIQGIAVIRGRVVLADNQGAAIFGSGTVWSGTMAAVYPRNNATRGMQFFPASGATANLIETYNLSGSVGFGVSASGFAYVNTRLAIGQDTLFASGLTISPAGAGSTSESERGIGFGKTLYIEGGASDNTAGKTGGDLVLRAGAPTSPASGNGHIYLADRNTATTFVGMPIFQSGTSAPISGRFHVFQSGATNSFAIFENSSTTATNGTHIWLRRGVNNAFIANYDGDLRFFTSTISDERVRITATSGNLNVRLASGQVTNLQEWENQSGLPYSFINASGIYFGATNARFNLLNTQASGTVALTASSQRVQIADCSSGNITYQLPTVANLSGQIGTYFAFKKVDATANSMTIIPASGSFIEGNLSGQTTTTQYQSYRPVFNGSGWYLL